jgi:hypothetical protein
LHFTPESLFAERHKKRAPINNRSLYQIEHSQLILSASRPAVCTENLIRIDLMRESLNDQNETDRFSKRARGTERSR